MVEDCKHSRRRVKRVPGNTTNMTRHLQLYHKALLATPAPTSIRALLKTSSPSDTKPVSSAKRLDFDSSIVKLIIDNCLSFNVVDSTEFVRSIHTISGKSYLPPSRTAITDLIDTLYRSMTETLLVDVCANSISITTDGATFDTGASYIAVTAHYITSDFCMRDVCLMVAQMTESHTGEYVSELLDQVAERWKVEHRVFAGVTDNGSNFAKGVRINAHVKEELRCIIHTLQLSLEDATKEFVEFHHLCKDVQSLVCRIRNSHLLTEELLGIQVEQAAGDIIGLPSSHRPLRLIIDASTRFNSFCLVFTRLLEVKAAVIKLCVDNPESLSQLALTSEQWDLVAEMVEILRPVKSACDIMEASTAPSISLLIPLLCQLITHLAQVAAQNGASALCRSMCEFVRKNVYERTVEALESTTAQVSMMLDPRVRTKQLPQYNKAIATDSLRDAYRNFAEALQDFRGRDVVVSRPAVIAAQLNAEEKEDGAPAAKKQKCIFELVEEAAPAGVATELDYYLREPGIPLTGCPLKWWREKQGQYPILAEMARVYLAIPASSAPSERVFSVAKLTLDHKRRSLHPDRVSRLLFLKKNMQLYHTLQKSMNDNKK